MGMYDEVGVFTQAHWSYLIQRVNYLRRNKMDDKAKVSEIFSYHAPTERQIESMKVIRGAALYLAEAIITECPASADRTTAIRKIREAVMTANASIVLDGMV
jgi:hypothetical protein